MNLKKFISGVSAFAIAASAFAGMAVTANAVYSDTPVLNNGCTTTDNWSGTNNAVTFTANEDGALHIDATGGGDRYAIYTMPSEVSSITTGVIKASFKFKWSDDTCYANKSHGLFGINGTASTTLDGAYYVANAWTYNTDTSYYASNAVDTDITMSKNLWYTMTVEIDLDNDLMNARVVRDSNSSTITSVSNAPFTDTALNNIKVVIPRGYSTNPARTTYIDDITVYTAGTFAKSVKLSYQENGVEFASDTVTLSDWSQSVGDSYTYYNNAYINKNSKYYKADSNVYGGTVALELEGTVPLAYTEVTDKDIVLFREAEEFDTKTGHKTASSTSFSGGVALDRASSKESNPVNLEQTFAITTAGEYTIEVPMSNGTTSTRHTYVTITNTTTEETLVNNEDYSLSKNTSDTYSYTADLTAGTYNVKLYNGDASTGAWCKPDYLLVYSPKYRITKAATTNGSFTVSPADAAKKNETVTITPTAAEGYEVDTVSVATADVSDNGDGTYSFIMPNAAVEVSVTFAASTTTVPMSSNITLSASNGGSDSVTFTSPVSVTDKTIHVNIKRTSGKSNSNGGALTLTGTNLNIYGPNGGETARVQSVGSGLQNWHKTKTYSISDSSYTSIDLIVNSTSNGVDVYIDGKHIQTEESKDTVWIQNNTIGDLTGLTLSSYGTGTIGFVVDGISVVTTPDTYTVTGGGVDGKYITGKTVTLAGEPTSGFWYDGSNYYKVGDTYTVAGNVEFTDAAPVAPSANLEAANWTSNVEGWTASGNVLTDVKDNSVYGYMATLTANGIIYDSVKVAVKTTEEVPQTDIKPYSEYGQFKMTTGNAVFYVISDVELDTSVSRVYCE